MKSLIALLLTLISLLSGCFKQAFEKRIHVSQTETISESSVVPETIPEREYFKSVQDDTEIDTAETEKTVPATERVMETTQVSFSQPEMLKFTESTSSFPTSPGITETHAIVYPEATKVEEVKKHEETEPPEPEIIKETETEPEPIPEPEFDIGYWISFAQNYAGDVGLVLNPEAVDCWDNPTGANARSTCLERDLTSRLDRYSQDSDITDVWIWYEDLGGGEYDIYIGYA